MVELFAILAALSIVALFIYWQARRSVLPPKAQLVCDLWRVAEKKSTSEKTINSPSLSKEANSFA